MTFNYLNLVGNADLIKQLNYAMIYRLIVQHAPISRIQLAEISHLAPASITKITRQLIKKKLIREVDAQQSTGGRPAVSIEAKFNYYQTIAVQLSRSHVTIELYDIGGNCLASSVCPLTHFTQEFTQKYLIGLIEQFIQDNSKRIKNLIAISVVLPGLIDSVHGIVRYTPHIQVKEWSLAEELQKQFNVSIFLGNDIQSLALAESYFGTTQNVDDSILIRVHRGVGSGVIVNQQLLTNHNQSGCEVGHIQVDALGDRCHCGNFGCLENRVVNDAIEHRAKQMIEQGYPTRLSRDECNIANICHYANQGDELAIKLVKDAGENLGRAVAMMVNIFNPQRIVLAGELTKSPEVLLNAVNSALNAQSLEELRKNLTINCSSLDDRSAIGAFALVQQALFNGSLLMLLLENTVTI
ncbi:ROK family protein [Gilliamella sp. B2776]|uniref:ROK family protein n=1 Tax=unclassified Gilliamella TaxID=2685620 RepID=UPI00226A4A62|nr:MULTISPECIES: ROK family protein [unclassified Gilliamella]MCX8650165.1 ROK family protein [Gilliamella sp. B2779]MCX8653488.1 ROK family protein [Gilliamella sp. B2737]MCX8656343.1 ROK family protein [Gilliamella sp. B2894]MCX8665186.1 ROK family protein [Gilliamella sp. B2887]MCX8691964.1 ROK family protein [Gilliamella sp. B2776]